VASESSSANRDNAGRLLSAAALTGAFMLAELIGGIISGSLALLADAAHMLSDTVALSIAYLAARTARRPADDRRSYGYHRAEVLAAFVNGIALFGVAVWIVAEAVGRLHQPPEILVSVMLPIAALGLGVNLLVFTVLHRGDHHDLNLQGALLHVLGDLLGSLAAITAGLVILATGWRPIDPLLSILVAMLLIRSAWHLARRSSHILLEGTPSNVDVAAIRTEVLNEVTGVVDVHHVHVWSLKPGHPLLTMHVGLTAGVDDRQTLNRVKQVLVRRFGIEHATIQLEHGPCPDHSPRAGTDDRRGSGGC
jgi:cobalt-zinc-cadmium efflux system protein